jgi:hypothetical protein
MKATFTESEVKTAFDRFQKWLKERELPEDAVDKYMLMCENNGNYQFKNIQTRNYLYVNVIPKPFNL